MGQEKKVKQIVAIATLLDKYAEAVSLFASTKQTRKQIAGLCLSEFRTYRNKRNE